MLLIQEIREKKQKNFKGLFQVLFYENLTYKQIEQRLKFNRCLTFSRDTYVEIKGDCKTIVSVNNEGKPNNQMNMTVQSQKLNQGTEKSSTD